MASRVYINVTRKGYREYRGGNVSSRPYKANNPYSHLVLTWGGGADAVNAEAVLGPDRNHLNAVYRRFRDKATGETSQLLTAAAEWRSSLDMVARRANQLRRAYLALRRFDLPEFSRALSLSEPAKPKRGRRRRRMQRPTEAWLEYWMGWAPAAADIANAINNICQPYPDQKITVGVTKRYKEQTKAGNSLGSFYDFVKREETVTVAAFGKMRVTNHNLFLANQMGLLNPLQTAWEVVPFSFMVDWFVNVGQVLGSLTDFAGCTLYDQGTAMKTDVSYMQVGFYKRSRPDGTRYYDSYHRWARGEHKNRGLGNTPPPSLTMHFDRLSLTRAATSISLLVETFLSKK